jgi:hypothetical protein
MEQNMKLTNHISTDKAKDCTISTEIYGVSQHKGCFTLLVMM